MVTFIADGRVICVGIECLPIWAVPVSAQWAEQAIDAGMDVPEWAPVVIDAYRQLIDAAPGATLDTSEAAEAAAEPPEPAGPADDTEGRTGAAEAATEPVGEDSEAQPATDVNR